jgi:hypothetical protein
MPITHCALDKANVATPTQLKWIVGLLLGIVMHGIAGADEVDFIVKKLAVDNTREEIVTLSIVKVRTKRPARCDSYLLTSP